MKAKIGRYVGALIVTAVAMTVAVMVMIGGRKKANPNEGQTTETVAASTPVSVVKAELQWIEITDSYSGMIRPLERFSLGFEIPGRVMQFGANAEGEPLDEGDQVKADQVLAQLDDRVLNAQLEEATARIKECNARLENAQANLSRSDDLKQRGSRVITEADYQNHVTQVAVADAQLAVSKAQLETARKNLLDCELVSPVDGVISKRHVNVGESVNRQQTVLEIIQVDHVLLVVGVPEAYVSQVRVGQEADVELLARDRFRRKRPASRGRVYQVAEAADQTTGLFEVEIALPNPDGRWKPGQIAMAGIVIDKIQGYRVPTTCTVHRDDRTLLFTVDKAHKAHCFDLKREWIEQGPDMVIFAPEKWAELRPNPALTEIAGQPRDPSPPQLNVVVNGQHRLAAGSDVELVEPDEERPVAIDTRVLTRSPASLLGSKPQAEARD